MTRGEIYVVDLGPGVGREVSGPCPVVVVSSGVSGVPLFVVVVPAVSAADIRSPMGVHAPSTETGYTEALAVTARLPRALDASRFPDQLSGTIPDGTMAKVVILLAAELDLKP